MDVPSVLGWIYNKASSIGFFSVEFQLFTIIASISRRLG